ncbi:LysM peptidoglycan-binding domain-containing protein [Luteimonas sp. SX5]|uniref:LysM peptidoglycan-binding domain-containing protein n=1 Tax=Luteimonas galliterrae TaxID=2940486 RepID=A0ABT0MJB0_9GAMM|nr:LysM peptidoglycan-binding domain-containing protein [Luteimonas galliterrae]MCL1634956.1 LysM peptidoglycan-binding domain-containing protein [Luteimonas galliterrae]
MLKRLSRGLRTVFAVAMLTVATYAAAVELRGDHPDTYVVRRGDTLWDISARFLKKPWLWPEIWQANPQIKNPHLIYPGDVISLAYLDRLAVQPGPRSEAAPINAIPLDQVEAFLKDMRVVDEFEQLPYVVSLEGERLRGTQNHVVYVRGLTGAQPGQRYLVVRPGQRYTQTRRMSNGQYLPFKEDLDYRGKRLLTQTNDFNSGWTNMVLSEGPLEKLGYELARINAGTVTRGEVGNIEVTTLLLDEVGREVRVGDRVIPVDALAYDLQFFPHPPKTQLPVGKAQVLAVADANNYGGPRDVVAISAGARDGIDNGTVFSIWSNGNKVIDRVEYGDDRSDLSVPKGSRVQLPDEFTGHVMVFRTFDKMSYGLVMEGIKPTRVGYSLKHPDATY